MLKISGFALSFLLLPQDLVNDYAQKINFNPHIAMHFVTHVFLCDDAYAFLFRKEHQVVSILAIMEWLRISTSCLEVYLSNIMSY